MMPIKPLLAGLVVIVAVGGALAHEGATGIVKDRMIAMETVGAAMKTLAPMFRGKSPYDPAKVRAAARTIRDHGGEALLRMFPEGSLDAPTTARPEIWTDWESFAALANRLATVAGEIERSALTPPQDAFRELARTCATCHKSFRVKKH